MLSSKNARAASLKLNRCLSESQQKTPTEIQAHNFPLDLLREHQNLAELFIIQTNNHGF
jgi:hypothetical protein